MSYIDTEGKSAGINPGDRVDLERGIAVTKVIERMVDEPSPTELNNNGSGLKSDRKSCPVPLLESGQTAQ